MKQKFLQNNYEIVDFEEKADVYVVNTCTVTNIADRKSRQILRRVKQINPDAILVVTGCYVQVAKEQLEKIDEIDIILGNNEKSEIIKYIDQFNKKEEVISEVLTQREFVEFGPTIYTEKTRAVIKVQDGCDRFCSYCIIPYARGRVRSRKLENVIEEVKEIANQGFKEIVVTGIHVASYGKDLKENIGLIDLLEEINKIDGIERIRLGSLEPTLITEEFVDRLSKLDKICDHFHLSLQSGCDETLSRMNRRYTTGEFRKTTNLLKKVYPNVALTTDIIVGFPGETDEEFDKTYKYLKEIDFYMMHIFKYSQRQGTKAAIMKNQIDGKIKEERSNKLIELSNENRKRHNSKYLGKNLKVLFEEKDGKYIKGHTTNYIVVKVESNNEDIENTIKNVKITNIEDEDLIGIIE